MSEWLEVSLTELYEISSGLSKPADAFGSGFPFLSFKEVFNNFFLPDKLEQLVESSEKEREKGSIKRGDVFITRTSETMHELGMTSVALKNYPDATFNGFTKRLRLKREQEHKVHPEFIGYYFRSPAFRRGMIAFSTLSTRASLNNDMLSRLTIKLPAIETQRKIAEILQSFDNKISINGEINKNLESIAQAIFKSWFIDFYPTIAKINAIRKGEDPEVAAIAAISGKRLDMLSNLESQKIINLKKIAALFPDELVNSQVGKIPRGWSPESIYGIADVIYGAPFKSKLFNDKREGIPLVRIRDLKNERPVVSTTEEHKKGYLINNGDLLVGMDGEFRPYIWGGNRAWMNQRVCCFKPKDDISTALIREFISQQLKFLESTAVATTVIHLGKGDIDKFTYLETNNDLLKICSRILEPIFQKIVNNKVECISLEESRNTLLRQLLSGELEFNRED